MYSEKVDYKAKRVHKTLSRVKYLEKNRHNFRSLWEKVGRYVVPNKNDVYQTRVPGETKTQDIFDSSATRYNRELASGLYYLASNPTNRWYSFSTGIRELDEDIEVRKYLFELEEIQTQVMNRTNFHTEVQSTYEDLPSFGTGVLFTLEDDELDVKYMSKQIYDCLVGENYCGQVNEIYVYYKWTLRQIVEEYGLAWMNDEIRSEYDAVLKGCAEKEHKVIYGIFKWSDDISDGSDRPSEKFDYFAHLILEKCKLEIKTENFEGFPAAVPRFIKLTNEVYGRSPSIDSMPDIATLNSMMKVVLMGGQLAIAPPLQMTDNSLLHPLRWKPFGANYRRPGSEEIKPLITGTNPGIGLEIIKFIQENVKDAFFINQLRLIEQDRMTATEVNIRRDEQFRSLGAGIGRIFSELLGPTIERTFEILAKRKKFPPMPEKLANVKNLQIHYTSMIARAQASIKGEALNRALQASATLLQANPILLKVVNEEKAFRKNLDIYGVDYDVLNSEREFSEIVKQQQEQLAEQQRIEQEKIQSETNKNDIGAVAGA